MKKLLSIMAIATFLNMQFAFAEALTEEQATDLINIESTPIKLKSSRFKKKYSAYKVIMTSQYPGSISVQSGDVTNGIAGTLAYKSTKQSAGWQWIWLFFPYVGIIMAPVGAVIAHGINQRAEEESLTYTGKVPLVEELKKGEIFEFTTLVPFDQKPSIRLVLRDKVNNLTFVKSAK